MCYIYAQPQMWKSLINVMGQPELADDPRFATAGWTMGEPRRR